MTTLQNILGQNIKHYRQVNGINQKEFVETSGIAQARLSRIENGQLDVGLQTVEKLAQGLGVSPSALLFDRSDMSNGVNELILQIKQLSPIDQKLVEALLESLLDKARLAELHNSQVKDRLEELRRLRNSE